MEGSVFGKNSGAWNSCNAVINKLFDTTPDTVNKVSNSLNSVDALIRTEAPASSSSELAQQTGSIEEMTETIKQLVQWQTL
nr:unnamed protein product [Spirometra erinaceieuropaei]